MQRSQRPRGFVKLPQFCTWLPIQLHVSTVASQASEDPLQLPSHLGHVSSHYGGFWHGPWPSAQYPGNTGWWIPWLHPNPALVLRVTQYVHGLLAKEAHATLLVSMLQSDVHLPRGSQSLCSRSGNYRHMASSKKSGNC